MVCYFFTVGSIVSIDGFSSVRMICSTVESAVFVVSPKTVIFEDIKHGCKLGKEKNAVTICFAPEVKN